MKYYQDITIIACDEIGVYHLWEKIYQQVHIALVENKNEKGLSDFGLTFPEYKGGNKPRLGRKLRVFATTQAALERLNLVDWLKRLQDYVHITRIREVGEVKSYIRFSRVQVKSNKERLARRKAKREGISIDDALKALEDFSERTSYAPFIRVKSLSNGGSFRLLIEAQSGTGPGNPAFSLYGLSKAGYLPNF